MKRMKKYNVIIPYRHKGDSRIKVTFNAALEINAPDDSSAIALGIEEFQKLTAMAQVTWEKEILYSKIQIRLIDENLTETLEFTTNFKSKHVAVLKLAGVVDQETIDRFNAQLNILKIRNFQGLILDFEKLDYMNSSGIGVLVENLSIFKIVIVNANPKVREILELVGLTKILNIVADYEAANRLMAAGLANGEFKEE